MHRLISLFVILFISGVHAQSVSTILQEKNGKEIETKLVYEEKELFWNRKYSLETIIYPASNPNGKIVIWQHGSVTNRSQLAVTHRLMRIANEFNSRGYTFVIWMRKGRGNSSGTADEYSGRDCDVGYIEETLKGTENQTKQVIEQLRNEFKFNKAILIGHSRGGIISAHYASTNPNDVEAVVNLAGGYALPCDSQNGNNSKRIYEKSIKFKKQKWIYFDSDPFFNPEMMNYIRGVTKQHNISLVELSGNHAKPLIDPSWVELVINWIEEKQ